jgi:hypothetical protein
MTFSHKPQVPLIYLTNTDETHIIETYINDCLGSDGQHAAEQSSIDVSDIAAAHPFLPALWYVKRNGHCNVNALERWHSLLALIDWIEGIQTPTKIHDVTHVLDR